jgi:hypothetical protein
MLSISSPARMIAGLGGKGQRVVGRYPHARGARTGALVEANGSSPL